MTTAPAPAPLPAQPTFTFMAMVKKSDTLPKSSRSKLVDPLTLAKEKIVKALQEQKRLASLVAKGETLPKTDGGKRDTAVWFSKQRDGWWTKIRYGQAAMLINGHADFFIGKIEDMPAFYDLVITSIEKGELDAQIGALQEKKSAALKRAA